VRRRIVTYAGAAYLDWSTVDLVVRAEAGAGLPPIPQTALRVPATSSVNPLVIVDVDDVDHGENRVLSRLSQQRRGAYRRAGSYDVDANPELVRMRDFLQELRK
jgi:hypothetical protein